MRHFFVPSPEMTASRVTSSCSQFREHRKDHSTMKKHLLLTLVVAFVLPSVMVTGSDVLF
jgi:hypothetical protein